MARLEGVVNWRVQPVSCAHVLRHMRQRPTRPDEKRRAAGGDGDTLEVHRSWPALMAQSLEAPLKESDAARTFWYILLLDGGAS